MEYVLSALGIILAIVAVVLILKFIKFLFTNFITSRALSIGTAIASLVIALVNGDQAFEKWLPMVILTTLSYLFMIGEVIFDVEWDGTFDLDFDTGIITPRQTGGFLMNAVVGLMLCGGAYIIFGSESPVVFYLFPIAILLFDAWSIFMAVRSL